jgi:hypothetical protein
MHQDILPPYIEWPVALDDEPEFVILAAIQISCHPLATNTLDGYPNLLAAARAWHDEMLRPGGRDITHFLMDCA